METKKTVLVALAGMSPAVVTETIWALSKEKPDWVPDEVRVYTTTKGEEAFRNGVLHAKGKGKSIWAQLTEKVGKPAMRLNIETFTDYQSKELADISTSEQQMMLADCLLSAIRNLKNEQGDPCRIVASIAGGRKSMSALMYAAMTYGADEEDIITHVLADKYASDCRRFFFPEQRKQKLTTDHGKEPFSAMNVSLELAEIPFAPLRCLVGSAVADARGSFATLVGRARQRLAGLDVAQTQIRISRTNCVATINGKSFNLAPEEYILLAMLVHFRKTLSGPGVRMPRERGKKVLEDLIRKQMLSPQSLPCTKKAFSGAWSNIGEVMPNAISKVKGSLEQTLKEQGFAHVAADALGRGQVGFMHIHDVGFLPD